MRVCPDKVLAFSEDERNLPRQLPVQRVAPDGASPGDRAVRVRWVKPPMKRRPATSSAERGEPAGRNRSEPMRASK